MTADHSVSYCAYLSKEINYTDIRFHEDKNKLTRALGNDVKIKTDLSDEVTPQSGDAFLLCTDGFWEYVFETEMEIDLLKSKTAKQWFEFMLTRHYERRNPDNDNFSAIMAMVQ